EQQRQAPQDDHRDDRHDDHRQCCDRERHTRLPQGPRERRGHVLDHRRILPGPPVQEIARPLERGDHLALRVGFALGRVRRDDHTPGTRRSAHGVSPLTEVSTATLAAIAALTLSAVYWATGRNTEPTVPSASRKLTLTPDPAPPVGLMPMVSDWDMTVQAGP